jgi:hypothetical protein
LQPGSFALIEVLELERHSLSGAQVDRAGADQGTMARPVVNHRFVINPQPHAFIVGGVKRVRAGGGCGDLSRPAHTESIWVDFF